jgi:hypothetical protein
MYRAQLPRATRPKAPAEKKSANASFVGNRTERFALQKKLGVSAMPSSAYFRRQADICLRLSLIASDEEVSNRLITMSREYLAKSHALAGEADTQPAPADHGPGSPAGDIDPGEASLGLSPQMQAPRLDP